MNKTQRKVLLVTAAVLALMIVFPPYIVKDNKQVTLKTGYGLLFNLPPYLAAPRSTTNLKSYEKSPLLTDQERREMDAIVGLNNQSDTAEMVTYGIVIPASVDAKTLLLQLLGAIIVCGFVFLANRKTT
jgi:hypothetical protein